MNSALLIVCLCGAAPAAGSPHPIVPAYERFHGSAALDDVAAGRLLLGELNCATCHDAASNVDDILQTKKAPLLTDVGDRVRPEFIRALLIDPQAVKPGTTMPDLFVDVPIDEKQQRVEALTHFLASTMTEPQRDRYVDKSAVGRGEKLFHEVGCAACHGSRKPKVEPFAFSMPLGDPASKYTVGSLTEFLFDPFAVRPSGRMPKCNLTEDEARDVASYFLQDVPGDPNVNYEYYEGRWNELPDFSILTPKKTGTATGFDVTVGPKREKIAMRFIGYLHMAKDANSEIRLTSDDGSRLLIDDVMILENDGVHPETSVECRSIITAGVHKITVEWFNDVGERSLKVELGRPKKILQNLASMVTLTPDTKPATDDFQIDPKLAAEGRKLFASTGCASCHELKENDKRIEPASRSVRLDKLHADRGCLAEQPKKAPNYRLNAGQRKSLAAAIAWIDKINDDKKSPLTAAERTRHMLGAFNCYACHRRDNIGGVDMTPGLDLNEDGLPDVDPLAERMAAVFVSAVPEMGDEGRLPPKLDGVGSKLSSNYLRVLLTNGAKDRLYMKTVMPDFGGSNVGRLGPLFEELDPPLAGHAPEFKDPPYRVKADGRLLVGTKGFSCVKCHNFNDKKAEGIPGIDMTILTKRLRPEWFASYVRDPQKFRPGTRMPTVFPGGQSTLKDIQDGDVDRQIYAVWDFLTDGKKAPVPVGVGGQPIELIAVNEPVVYRNFLEHVGPRAMAIGYPEKANLSFDVNQLRPAIIWHGAFLDASIHWTGRGGGTPPPLGDDVVVLAPGPNFAHLKDDKQAWPTTTNVKELGFQFRGYRLDAERRPNLMYTLGDVAVVDVFRPVKDGRAADFARTIDLTGGDNQSDLWFRAAAARDIKPLADDWYEIDKLWRVRLMAGTAKPIIRSSESGQELIVPIVFDAGRAKIEQEYLW